MIIAAELTQDAKDLQQLEPMLATATATLGAAGIPSGLGGCCGLQLLDDRQPDRDP